jgi:sulfatase maturation enzyme AslB (radical SAM superfamily)
MFYAPGYVCVADLPHADHFRSILQSPGKWGWQNSQGFKKELDWANALWGHAEQALARSASLRDEPFRPECLMLYLNNECNLNCVYCYSDPSSKTSLRLEMGTITAAAKVVIEHCRRKDRPLYVVFHGGGEPTLDQGDVDQAMRKLDQVTQEYGVGMLRYLATNGAMSEGKARWLASCFNLVGLSCDGPADIQNSQRPFWNGAGSSSVVERTGHILRNEGCRLRVRTTITQTTVYRQAEIANYICQQFSPEEIHFEPVYRGKRTVSGVGFDISHAQAFVEHFCEAQEVSRSHGIRLTISGSRPGSIHGPYCHVFRSVLNLVPGGVATACFKISRAAEAVATGAVIGKLDRETGSFQIDYPHLEKLRHRLDVYAPECTDCFNRYHCVRHCPDRCPLDGDSHHAADEQTDDSQGHLDFRCQVQKALTYKTLHETAEGLWAAAMKERSQQSTHGDTGEIIRGTRVL